MTYYKGQQFYKEVSRLPLGLTTVYRTGAVTNGESVNYSGYPLYQLFYVDDAEEANKRFGLNGLIRISLQKYWNPYPLERGVYKEYTPGDELVYWVFNKAPSVNIFQIPGVSPISTTGIATKPADPVSSLPTAGTSIVYASSTYRATNSYVEWGATGADLGITNPSFVNPYGTKRIQLWIKFDPIKNSTIGNIYYWWHPTQKIFYSIPVATKIYDSPTSSSAVDQQINEGKIQSLILQGNTRAQAITRLTSPSGVGVAQTIPGPSGTKKVTAVTNKNGSSTTNASTAKAQNAPIKATVRVRGNFGFVNPGEPDGGSPQMVQYYQQGTSPLQEPDRHIFSPKPNQINYQNLGSEWTEIERVGRIPLVDWKNFRLMKISFQFIVIPDATYRLGAYGATADDGITLSIDDKLDTLRNMATRPYPVILFGFDELLTNSSQFSNSAGSGVQFVINDFSISSMMRTPAGAVNRATCDITLQEVPIEYINLISMPKLVPGQTLPARNTNTETPFGERARDPLTLWLPEREA
jgi:hypothetical protein